MDQNHILKLLQRLDLFKPLDQVGLRELVAASIVQQFHQDEEVVRDLSEEDDYLYLILKGEVLCYKSDPIKGHDYTILNLKAGELLGEAALFDSKSIIYDVRAVTESEVLKVPFSFLKRHFAQTNQSESQSIYGKFVNVIQSKFAQVVDKYVHVVDEERRRYSLQQESNIFLFVVCMIFGMGMLIDRLVTVYYIDVRSLFFNWTYLGLVLMPVLAFIFYCKYPFSQFGVTRHNLGASLKFGLFLLGIIFIAMILGVRIQSEAVDIPLYNEVISKFQERAPVIYSFSYLFHSFVQEFIARGVMLTSIQKFLEDKQGWKANFVISLIFGLFHIHHGIGLAVTNFIASFLFGLIYLRDRNLAGVTLVHWSAGIMSRVVIGF